MTSSRTTTNLPYACWGEDIDSAAHDQMKAACRLPVSVAGALMPDAHVGYGLPIGGVLATKDCVIPYAVGVDIACRVMLTVFDASPEMIDQKRTKLRRIVEECTRFGVGAHWKEPSEHAVMDEDWSVSPVAAKLKDLAWQQLGTSGSGNHFVEWGVIEFAARADGSPARSAHPQLSRVREGSFLALVSHSGSRGAGAKICDHYSRLAKEMHPKLSKDQAHLGWLPLSGIGAEYWAAMELMGKYASANHHIIHDKIVSALGEDVLIQVENHHNFAWKEEHGGEEVIVHRKGATPAPAGALGYIPGTMVDPGFLVLGKGDARSLDSASHGAGRQMSRRKARDTMEWGTLRQRLKSEGVDLMSAGLDESPHAYKDIRGVMAAQEELVEPIATFQPRIVKMAPDGERAED